MKGNLFIYIKFSVDINKYAIINDTKQIPPL